MSSTTPPTPTPIQPSIQTQLKTAGSPFDSPDADIIIRSSDECDFRVHRLILSLGSVTFKDMFAAQPYPFLPSLADITVSHDSESSDFQDGLPVIRLTETSGTLRTLLKLLYPGDHPEVSGRAATIAILNAMDKYMVEDYPRFIHAALRSVLEEAPHLVLAFAFRRTLSFDLRSRAAYHTLLRPAATISDDVLELLTPFQYHQILTYHEQCVLQASLALKDFGWVYCTWALVSVGSKTEGTVVRLAENTDGCTCSRTVRSKTPDFDGDTDVKDKTLPLFYIAFWAAEFITGVEACLWQGPHWDKIDNDKRRASAARGARDCGTCSKRAKEELRLIAAYMAHAVKEAIMKVCIGTSGLALRSTLM